MAKPDFKELHPDAPSTPVGPDLGAVVATDVFVGSSDDFIEGGGAQSDVQSTVQKPASFSVYWDVQGRHFSVFDPKVVGPDGSEITVKEPSAYSRGTYVCEVKHSKARGETTAEIKLDSAVVPSEETIRVVKLFKIEDGEVDQYHTGVIALTNVTITGEEGEELGSEPEPISGAIQASGAQGSGLKVSTYKEAGSGGQAYLVIDVERTDEETKQKEFGLHKFTIKGKDKDEEDRVYWFFGDENITIEHGGVESLNRKTGALNIIGGKHIRVESESEKTIKISYDEDKENEDEDPNADKGDPCGHPGDKDGGGVKPDDDDGFGGGGGAGGGGGGGGVGPDGQGEPHIGDNGCEGCGCT